MKWVVIVSYFILSLGISELALPDTNTNKTHTAHLVLVEYLDYQCPHCRAMQPILDDLQKNNKDFEIIYRPLGVLNPSSVFLARAALAAQRQQQFSLFHATLMSSSTGLTPQQILSLVSMLGLSLTQFKQDIFSVSVTHALENNLTLAKMHDPMGHVRVPLILIGNTSDAKFSDQFVGEVSEAYLQSSLNRLSQAEQLSDGNHFISKAN